MEAIDNGLRLAALFVHCLHPADSAWVLDRLDEMVRSRVGALTEELRVLGIPAQQELVKAVLKNPPPRTAASAMMALPADVVAGILRDEPHELAAELLLLGEHPWRVEILSAFGAHERRAIEALLPGATPPGPRRRDALIAGLLAATAQNGGGRATEARQDTSNWRIRMPGRWFRRSAGGRP